MSINFSNILDYKLSCLCFEQLSKCSLLTGTDMANIMFAVLQISYERAKEAKIEPRNSKVIHRNEPTTKYTYNVFFPRLTELL